MDDIEVEVVKTHSEELDDILDPICRSIARDAVEWYKKIYKEYDESEVIEIEID